MQDLEKVCTLYSPRERASISLKPEDFCTFSTYIFSQEFGNADQALQTLSASGAEYLNCGKK